MFTDGLTKMTISCAIATQESRKVKRRISDFREIGELGLVKN